MTLFTRSFTSSTNTSEEGTSLAASEEKPMSGTREESPERHTPGAGTAVYLRFGGVPKGGRSRGFDGFGLGGAGHAREAGTSVFSARKLRDGEYLIQLRSKNAAQSLVAIVVENRRVYEVEGEMVGRGSDGEPLLSVTDRRRVMPPIRLAVNNYEEEIAYCFSISRQCYMPDRGETKPDTSRLQQVTSLGRHRLGSPPKSKRKKRKKK